MQVFLKVGLWFYIVSHFFMTVCFAQETTDEQIIGFSQSVYKALQSHPKIHLIDFDLCGLY